MALTFDRDFDPAYTQAIEIAPGVSRLTARNPGPFTFHGTNTYLVGRDTLAVIDPGPDDDEHLASLLDTIAGRPVSHILVSHSHRDHSPLSRRLSDATGAQIYAEGPHRTARGSRVTGSPENGAHSDFCPDVILADGETVEGDGWTLKTVLTPGHAANHSAFALDDAGILFSGDHVMGWSTTIVAPPDGSMADYMTSLTKLIDRGDRMLLPGHGGPINEPTAYMNALRDHRLTRERAIVERLNSGDRNIGQIVQALYKEIDPAMYPAASLSVLAHLEHLVERGLVESEGAPSVGGIFRPVQGGGGL